MPDPDSDFNFTVDEFDTFYPNLQPYEDRENNRYYIAAAWEDLSSIPIDEFEIGDESRTNASRSGMNESYFNAELEPDTSYCLYLLIHNSIDGSDNVSKTLKNIISVL